MSVPFPSAHGGGSGGGGVGEEVEEDEEDEGTSRTAGEQRKNGHEKLKLKTEGGGDSLKAGAEDAGESIHRPLESLQRAIDQLNTYHETYLRLKH